jgi:LysM repeat protein
MASVAAALCLSPGIATAATTATAASHPVILDAAVQSGSTTGWPAGALAERGAHAAHAVPGRASATALPASYTVRTGDTLSSIARHFYHDRAAWPVLYWRNHRHIRWANEITAGQVLRIPVRPARIPHAPGALQPAGPAAPSQLPAMAAAPADEAGASYTGATPGGSFGQCVIERESGGQAQIMNATGHYGLYQFSAATWAAYGGDPADFGHASVAEQNKVFASALAAGGESNWAPYDGC